MISKTIFSALAICAFSAGAFAQGDFRPVTNEILQNPDPADWLMINRTLDQQRYSPLNQINRENARSLTLAWSRGLSAGTQESTPIVYRGVMYAYDPGAGILALDAKTGDLIWQYRREYSREVAEFVGSPQSARSKALAIWQDMIYYDTPDGFIVAIGVADGKVRWETRVTAPATKSQHTGGILVADGKVISNRSCETWSGCFIAAHDGMTGKELWKFYTAPRQGEPGGDTWGNMPDEQRIASSWGMPGSYDPATKTVYWAIANQKPYTRLKRHGSAEGVSRTAPAELYSNSTVALDVESGKLKWYYQHLPGDDWDADHIHERTIVRAPFNPTDAKWSNPNAQRGQMRDMVVSVGEGGGIFAVDKNDGQFLWASPFPYDIPEFNLSSIDPVTGRTTINWNNVLKKEGDRVLTCFHNTRSYWSTSYNPNNTSLYVPFHDQCLDMEARQANPLGFGKRFGVLRPGGDINKYAGIAKINLSTGKMDVIHQQPEPGNGSALVTGGGLLFWGDVNRRFRAFDADNGKILWETIVGGVVMTSTITYSVDGRQYVAIFTGAGQSGTAGVLSIARNVRAVRNHNALYVFALPK
jgi:alcohol dehydrogenase (cytochrome c)